MLAQLGRCQVTSSRVETQGGLQSQGIWGVSFRTQPQTTPLLLPHQLTDPPLLLLEKVLGFIVLLLLLPLRGLSRTLSPGFHSPGPRVTLSLTPLTAH